MAVFNEILVGRFARSVQKLFGVKAAPPVNALSSDVMAVHPYFTGAENRYLEGWQRYATRIGLVAGGAGNTNNLRVRNPGNSNIIAVFESVVCNSESAGTDGIQVTQGSTASDLTGAFVINLVRWDARGQQNPMLVFSTQVNPGVFGTLRAERNLPAINNTEFILTENQEWPLLPGDALQLNQLTANQQVTFSFTWRERFLEDSERS